VLADADQGDSLGGHAEAGRPVQDLDDLQLVVEDVRRTSRSG
jgi:hypothetical protein